MSSNLPARTGRRHRAAVRRSLVAVASSLAVAASGLPADAAVQVSDGARIAIFGDNYTDEILSEAGFATVLVNDEQLRQPGFLNAFDAFYYTREGSSFGESLSPAAASNVRSYAARSRVLLLNGDFADAIRTGDEYYDPEVVALTVNATAWAAASGRGFVGELNGAAAGLSSNSNELEALSFVPGAAGPLQLGPAIGTMETTTAGQGHEVLQAVDLPRDPDGVEHGAEVSDVPDALVLARYSESNNPAIIARNALPLTKSACKKRGWRVLTDDAGKPFKSLGACLMAVKERA